MITHLEFITLMNVSNTSKLIDSIRYQNSEVVYTYYTFHFIFSEENGLNTVYVWCPKDGDNKGLEVKSISDLMFFFVASSCFSLDTLLQMYFSELQKNINLIFDYMLNRFRENLDKKVNFTFHDSNEILQMIELFLSSTLTIKNREFSFKKYNLFKEISKTVHFNVDFSNDILFIEMDNIDANAYSCITITSKSIDVHLTYFPTVGNSLHYIYRYSSDKHEVVYSLRDDDQFDEDLQTLNTSDNLLYFLLEGNDILERKFDFNTESIIDEDGLVYSSLQIDEELSCLKEHIKSINDVMEKAFIQYFV